MIRLVVNILLLIVLAVFIGFNTSFRTSVNLFGFRQVDDVSVLVVILLSMVLGVLYSLFFYLSSAVVRVRRGRRKEREMLTRQRLQELEREREGGMGAPGARAPGVRASDAEPNPDEPESEPERRPGDRRRRPLPPS